MANHPNIYLDFNAEAQRTQRFAEFFKNQSKIDDCNVVFACFAIYCAPEAHQPLAENSVAGT